MQILYAMINYMNKLNSYIGTFITFYVIMGLLEYIFLLLAKQSISNLEILLILGVVPVFCATCSYYKKNTFTGKTSFTEAFFYPLSLSVIILIIIGLIINFLHLLNLLDGETAGIVIGYYIVIGGIFIVSASTIMGCIAYYLGRSKQIQQ